MVIASILPGAVASGPLHIFNTGCGEGTASLSQQGRLSGGSQAVTVLHCSGREGRLWSQIAWVQVPTLLLTALNLGQFLNLGTAS